MPARSRHSPTLAKAMRVPSGEKEGVPPNDVRRRAAPEDRSSRKSPSVAPREKMIERPSGAQTNSKLTPGPEYARRSDPSARATARLRCGSRQRNQIGSRSLAGG